MCRLLLNKHSIANIRVLHVTGILAIFFFVYSCTPLPASPLESATAYIADKEAFKGAPYRDESGLCTRGYGQLLSHDPGADCGQWRSVTESEARKWLRDRVKDLLTELEDNLSITLRDEQWVALASLAYNIGISAFGSSLLVDMINGEEPLGQIMREWLSWDHITIHGKHQVSPGLDARRVSEVGLYVFGIE